MSVSPVPPPEVVTAAELALRPCRRPEYRAESRAMVLLAETLATTPNAVLQRLVDLAVDLCGADSAGVSLIESADGSEVFRWRAIAGSFAGYAGQTIAREQCPCGTVVDRGDPLLITEPVGLYPSIAQLSPHVFQVLVVPVFRCGVAIGTVWLVSHSADRTFDSEDSRLITSLAQFASAAVQAASDLADARERLEASLAAAEVNTKYRFFFEQGSRFAGVLSLDGTVVEVNRPALEACGLSRSDVLGRPFWECGWWNRSPALMERVRAASLGAAAGHLFEQETPYFVADGTERMADLILAPVTDSDNRVLFVAATGTDITERRSADLALREAHSRIETTLAAAEVATWTWDIRTDRVLGDRNLLRMFSLPPEANGGPRRLFLQRVHPDDVDRVSHSLRAALETGEPYEAEYRVLRSGGGYCHFISRGRVEYDDDHQPVRMPGVLLDITRQKRAEEELAALLAREQQHTDLLRSVAGASRLLNAFLSVESIAKTMAEEARSIIGARRAVVTFTGSDEWRREQTAISVDDEPGDHQHSEGDGLAVPLCGQLGQSLGCVHLFDKRDGGFTPDDEAVLVQLAAIGSVGIENACLYERLRDQDKRKDEFLATLAHELRNPLAPMWNALSVLRRNGLATKAAPMLEMLDRQLAALARLVDDLLDVSRVTSGKIVLRKERVELRTVIDAAVETSRPVIEEGRHTLTVRIPEGSLPIEADSVRIAQVLTNLLNNAAKYTPPGGRIEILADREGSELVVRVRDTGVGIAPEMLSRVFDMFTQVGASVERAQGGLGIGLTLVRKLVELHGGRVLAESRGAGWGSTFVVRLPLAPAAHSAAPVPEDEASRTGPSRRILVVDDNRDTAHSLALLLQLDGHEARTAYDGPGALDVARAWRPEVVLLDIGLPGMSGYEVAQRIRADPDCAGVVLIAVTGWGADEDRERSRQAGFDHHLVKPVDPDRVTRLVASSPRSVDGRFDLQEH